jgi:hypothetical protein
LTGREKLELALRHRSGPVPLDFGATVVTGIHCSIVEKLREHYGLSKRLVTVYEPFQMLGLIEDDLKAAIGVDTDAIHSDSTMFGFPPGGDKEWVAPWGQTVLVPEDFNTKTTECGDVYIYPCGDSACSPCAHMPGNGYFFDSIIRGHTYEEDHSNPQDNLEEFTPLSRRSLEYMRRQLPEKTAGGRGLVVQIGGTGIGDIALVPAPMLKRPKGLRDIAEWYMATVADPQYLHAIFERQSNIALQNLHEAYNALGDAVSVCFICGTDFGTQTGQFCSRETFRELYRPYYRRMNDWVHQNTRWRTFKHSCGAIRPLLGELIEAGFDIINPVQWSARDMDAETLKREYGKDLVFWGGGINTQSTLPFAKPGQVREEALRCLETFSRDGGYVYNTIHNIQAKTPVENVVAFIDAVHEFNG